MAKTNKPSIRRRRSVGNEVPSYRLSASFFGPASYYRSNWGDVQIISGTISANVLARIPDDLDLGIGPLYAWLERFCTPFRSFDLPPELRVNIYELVFASNASQSIGYPRSPLPALVHTNRQLRNEALPVYFSSSTFTLNVSLLGSNYMLQCMNDWRSIILNGAARLIRHLHVLVRNSSRGSGRGNGPCVRLQIHYREHDNSLELCTTSKMEEQSLAVLKGFLEDVPKTKALKGESVLMLAHTLGNGEQSVAHDHFPNWLDLHLKDGTTTARGGNLEDMRELVQLRVALNE